MARLDKFWSFPHFTSTLTNWQPLVSAAPHDLNGPPKFDSVTRRANPALGNCASDFPVQYAIQQLGVSTSHPVLHARPSTPVSSRPGYTILAMNVADCSRRFRDSGKQQSYKLRLDLGIVSLFFNVSYLRSQV